MYAPRITAPASVPARRAIIQPALQIGQPGDRYEREADAVADEVVKSPGTTPPALQRMSLGKEEEEGGMMQMKPLGESPALQMKCAACEAKEEEGVQMKPAAIQRKEGGMTASPQITQQLSARAGKGAALPDAVNQEMSSKIGADFSQVKVHTDSHAVQMSRDLGARAFTHGKDIYFNSGQYDPGSKAGRHLLAHELTHTVQQTGGIAPKMIQRQQARCTRGQDPTTIVSSHTVDRNEISGPGQAVNFHAKFACDVRSFESTIVKVGSGPINLRQFSQGNRHSEYTRPWNGKKAQGHTESLMVEDGEYVHRLQNITYAFDSQGQNMRAPDSDSEPLTIAIRDNQNIATPGNIEIVATIVRSEMGVATAVEQTAVAWAVRNQMARLNTSDAAAARDSFNDAHNQAPEAAHTAIATTVLQAAANTDPTDGGIKWFSPRSMPTEESRNRTSDDLCNPPLTDMDCGGGLHTVQNPQGEDVRVYFPSWPEDMVEKQIAGASEWHLKMYGI